jgi:hypothetical protein
MNAHLELTVTQSGKISGPLNDDDAMSFPAVAPTVNGEVSELAGVKVAGSD